MRLELAAEVMQEFSRELGRTRPPEIDREALLQGLRIRACGSCILRTSCLERRRLTVKVLEDVRPFPCRKPGRLGRELRDARQSLRRMEAERRREAECRAALEEQYLFLEEYLRRLADRLPGRPRAGSAATGYGPESGPGGKPLSAATAGLPSPGTRGGTIFCCAMVWAWARAPGRTAADVLPCCGSSCWQATRPGTPCGASILCWPWGVVRGR